MTEQDSIAARPAWPRPATGAAGRLLQAWGRRRLARRMACALREPSHLQLRDVGLLRAEIDRRFRP